jgi:hypothetical protein
VVWNRSPAFNVEALRHEAAGSRVIVAENGYTDAVDETGHQFFSLALDQHNGRGRWFMGKTSRLAAMGIQVQPWRQPGGRILVLPQRGVGPPGIAMPKNWIATTQARLTALTTRPIHIRQHPGLKSKAPPLEPDLAQTFACVTWGSGAGIKALIAGVPVFYDLPGWIGAGAAKHFAGATDLESVKCDDQARVTMLERLAWCQWRVSEIASGHAFDWLLSSTGTPA